MRFAFTDEQDMFRDTVRDLFADRCPPEAVRASWDNDDGRVPGLWSALADMGVLAALAPESAVTIALRAGGAQVVGAGSADLVVRETDSGLEAVTVAESHPVSSIDQSRRLAEIVAVGEVHALVGADAALAADRAALGTAAQCVGVARRLLDATVDYVGERYQFGKPVGSYQAVKHHLANVRLGIEFAAPLVYRAAWSVAHPETHDPEVRGRDVSMAKATASDAVDGACRVALQCHGAIGYTFEYDLQLWLKRGWTLAAAHGDARRHRDRVADALGI